MPFDCCPLATDDVDNTLFFAIFHTKFILLTLLLLLDEEALVRDKSNSLSPALNKEHAESYSFSIKNMIYYSFRYAASHCNSEGCIEMNYFEL